MRTSYGGACEPSPIAIPAGAGRWPTACCAQRAGYSTARAPSACGEPKGCAEFRSATSAAAPAPMNRSAFRATRPNHVWALDFQFDETADHRRLKLLNIVDEFTRQALAMRVGRSCTAQDVVTTIEALVAERAAPEHLRMDNGPELMAWALRDWCHLAGTETIYIEPGSPWETPFVESFNGRSRDELLNVEEFGTLIEAQVLVEAWRTEYNNYRPHSALGGLTPTEYALQWTTRHQPALS